MTYDEFTVDFLIANDVVVGVVVRDVADGELVLNLPIQGGLVGEREEKVMSMIRELLEYCLVGEIDVIKKEAYN